MAKRIDEVLSRRDLSQLIKLSYDMRSVYEARILENVLHIECENADDITVLLYPSLRNAYALRLPSKNLTKIPRRKDAKKLYERREKHSEFTVRRHETVLDEIRIRNHDIEVHKHYLSEREGYNVGWLVASAHWLKRYGSGFYDLSKKQHQDLGIKFEWKGMEKAVGIVAPNKEGIKTYYVVVRSDDFAGEERYAQACGGAMKVLGKEKFDIDVDMSIKIRLKLEALYDKYFCILGRKK